MKKGTLKDTLLPTQKRLIFIGGKGGVGKTSVASAIALGLAKTYNTLLISTDPAHSTADSLGLSSDDYQQPTTIRDNLSLMQLDSQSAFEEFKNRHENEIRLLLDTSTYMDEEDIDRMMSLMLPGIDEVMGLKSIIEELKSDRYEKVIVDTAPTGHALRLLFMPKVLDNWIKTMATLRWKYRTIQKTFKGKYTPDDADDMLLELKRLVSSMKNILIDGEACEFILVCLPFEMVINEAKRLYQELMEHNIQVNHLIINQLAPDSKDPFYHKLHRTQEKWVAAAQNHFPINILRTPLFDSEVVGTEALSVLHSHLLEQG